MAVMHNHEVMSWVEDYEAEGYTRAEAIKLARAKMEERKNNQARNSVLYQSPSAEGGYNHNSKLPPHLRSAVGSSNT